MSEPLAPSTAMNSDTLQHKPESRSKAAPRHQSQTKERRPRRQGENARTKSSDLQSWADHSTEPTTNETVQEKAMRQKYKAALAQVKDIFPSWPDLDILELLEEVRGDSRVAIERIAEGRAMHFSEVKRKEKKVVQEPYTAKHGKENPRHGHAHDSTHAKSNGTERIPRGPREPREPREKTQTKGREKVQPTQTEPLQQSEHVTTEHTPKILDHEEHKQAKKEHKPREKHDHAKSHESHSKHEHVKHDHVKHDHAKQEHKQTGSKIKSWAQIARPASPVQSAPPAPLVSQKAVPEKTILTNKERQEAQVQAQPQVPEPVQAKSPQVQTVEPTAEASTQSQSLWAGTPAAPTTTSTQYNSWKESEPVQNESSLSSRTQRGLGQFGTTSAAVQFGSLNLQDALAPSPQQAQQIQALTQSQPQTQTTSLVSAQEQTQQTVQPVSQYQEQYVRETTASQPAQTAQYVQASQPEYSNFSTPQSQYQAPTPSQVQPMPQHNQEWAHLYQNRGAYDLYQNYRAPAAVEDVERSQASVTPQTSQTSQAGQHDIQHAQGYGQMQGYPYGYYPYGMPQPYYAPQYQQYPKQAYQPVYGQEKPYPAQQTTQQAPSASQSQLQPGPVATNQNQAQAYGYAGLDYPMTYDRGYAQEQKPFDDKYAPSQQTPYGQNYPYNYQSGSRYGNAYDAGSFYDKAQGQAQTQGQGQGQIQQNGAQSYGQPAQHQASQTPMYGQGQYSSANYGHTQNEQAYASGYGLY